MIKQKVRNLLGRDIQLETLMLNKELMWSQIYHDSIRDKEWLTSLSLNIGRWAGGYSFFYVLNRILNDFEPKTILEMGLGESSKVISTYLDNHLKESAHTIVEQNENWMNSFNKRFALSARSSVHILPVKMNNVKGFATTGYANIEDRITQKFDLYVIDGPTGSVNYSRYDIINLAKSMNKNDDFIIIFDDLDRSGEQETLADLKGVFEEKSIEIHIGFYTGMKSVAVIATNKYQYACSL